MSRLFLFGVALALFTPMHGSAQNSCPWINAATVAGVLEAKVQTSVEEMPTKGMKCSFKGLEPSSGRSLVVEVRGITDRDKSFTEAETHCASAATPVRGLGNEAFECGVDGDGAHGMMMVGRVRDTLFVVTVMMPVHHEQGTAGATLEDKLTIATGQVVGNLF